MKNEVNRALAAKKRFIALLLAIVASVGTMFAESGTCGDNLTWDLTDGVLTISGTGAMTNWSIFSDVPWYPKRSSITEVSIGNSVTSIGNYAFYYTVLTSVTIGNSVTSIGKSAFGGCSALTSVTIPNNVTSIGGSAFEGCSGLTSIEIPNSVTSIGEEILSGCVNLVSIIAPAKVFDAYSWYYSISRLETIRITAGELTENALWHISYIAAQTLKTMDMAATTNTELADRLFLGMNKLQKLVLPANLSRINYMAIAECLRLEEITIPERVTEIDDRAFENCRSLKTVTFAGSALTTIGDWAFYNCHELSKLELPEGVTTIGKAAFYGCTYLNEVVMPASVQSIGDNAFALCSKLAKMNVLAVVPPTVEEMTFYEVSTDAPVYVPDESVEAYKSHAVWGRLNIQGKTHGMDDVQSGQVQCTKVLRDGQVLIQRGENLYTVTGVRVK